MDLKFAKFDETQSPKVLLNYDEIFITERLLTRGGLSDIYLVTGSHSNQHYVLKIIPNLQTPNFTTHTIFKREISVLDKIGKYPECHEYFPCYYDNFYLTNGDIDGYGILMEYITGTSLEMIIRENSKTFTFNEIYFLAEHLFTILSYLHRLGIVHRDIHRGNVILMDDGNIKLIDFGASCFIYNNDPELQCSSGRDEEDLKQPWTSELRAKSTDIKSAALFLSHLIGVMISPDTQNPYFNAVVRGCSVDDFIQRMTAEEALWRLKLGEPR